MPVPPDRIALGEDCRRQFLNLLAIRARIGDENIGQNDLSLNIVG